MTNQDYWQIIIGDQSPESFLRAYGTTDPELGLERFLEDRGQLYGVINQGTWASTFVAPNQYTALTARAYLLSYLEETREIWEPALEAQPPKVVRRYRPVYDFPVPDSTSAGASSSDENVTVPDSTPAKTDVSVPDAEKPSAVPAPDDATA